MTNTTSTNTPFGTLTMVASRVEVDSTSPEWAQDSGATGWSCEFTYDHTGQTATFPFYQGPAHTDPPTAGDVLECLLTDAHYIYEDEMDDLVADMPYSKAKLVVESMTKLAHDLNTLLGNETFDTMVYGEWDPED